MPGVRDLLPLAAADPARYPCLLESVAVGGVQARFDVLLAFPQEVLALGRDGCVRDARGAVRPGTFLQALDAAWRRERSERRQPGLPFGGGWALFLAYELAGEIEPRLRLPPSPEAEIPVALALRCPAAILVDRLAGQTLLIAEAAHAECLDALRADLRDTPPFDAALAPAAIEEDAP